MFLCDSGSVSVEVAVKMCLQYWHSQGDRRRRRLATWRGGYHGDTFMAMSVCDPEGGMHAMWDGVLAEQVFAGLRQRLPAGVDAASRYAAVADLRPRGLPGGGDRGTRGPGAGGGIAASLRVLREACSDFGVLLIFDEIATGFGRTGRSSRPGTPVSRRM